MSLRRRNVPQDETPVRIEPKPTSTRSRILWAVMVVSALALGGSMLAVFVFPRGLPKALSPKKESVRLRCEILSRRFRQAEDEEEWRRLGCEGMLSLDEGGVASVGGDLSSRLEVTSRETALLVAATSRGGLWRYSLCSQPLVARLLSTLSWSLVDGEEVSVFVGVDLGDPVWDGHVDEDRLWEELERCRVGRRKGGQGRKEGVEFAQREIMELKRRAKIPNQPNEENPKRWHVSADKAMEWEARGRSGDGEGGYICQSGAVQAVKRWVEDVLNVCDDTSQTTLSCGTIHIEFLCIRNPTPRSAAAVLNVAAQVAVDKGATYLVRVDDDAEFLRQGWLPNPESDLPNFPLGLLVLDFPKRSKSLAPFHLVHKIHIDIFHTLYPPSLPSWLLDDWIAKLYGGVPRTEPHAQRSFIRLLQPPSVLHTGTPGASSVRLDPDAKNALATAHLNAATRLLNLLQNAAQQSSTPPSTSFTTPLQTLQATKPSYENIQNMLQKAAKLHRAATLAHSLCVQSQGRDCG